MNGIKIIVLACITFLCIGCWPRNGLNKRDQYTLMKGEWDWVKATKKSGGETLTPGSEGYTQKLEIKNGGLASLYHNGEVFVNYTIKFQPPSERKNAAWVFFPEERGKTVLMYVSSVDQTHLHLSVNCSECYENDYIR